MSSVLLSQLDLVSSIMEPWVLPGKKLTRKPTVDLDEIWMRKPAIDLLFLESDAAAAA